MVHCLLNFFSRRLFPLVILGFLPLSLFTQNIITKNGSIDGRLNTNFHPQNIPFSPSKRNFDRNPSIDANIPQRPGVAPENMWDLQFLFRPADSIVGVDDIRSLAGVVYTGTEFWVSSWFSDTLIRLDGNGSFIEFVTFSNFSAVRSMSWDGNLIYMANNSTLIRGVDPTTKQVMNTIALSGGITARFAAYDSLADNGNGGFYVGNFGTNIYLVDMNGQPLDTIPYVNHNRMTIYGAAVDHISPGGPYLWVFDQPESPSYAVISQLKLPDGIYTGFSWDVINDMQIIQGAAGGIFITQDLVSGQNTIGGIVQNNIGRDILFGYDLDLMSRQYDAGMEALYYEPGYTVFPLPHAQLAFNGTSYNTGSDSIENLKVQFEIKSATGATVFSDSASYDSVPSYAANSFNFGPWVPTETGKYNILGTTSISPFPDEWAPNDTIQTQVEISDSVYARDDGRIINVLAPFSTPSQPIIMGQNFTLAEPDYLTSVSFILSDPDSGVKTSANVFGIDSITGRPNPSIFYGQSTIYETGHDTVSGETLITLPMDSFPRLLPAGEFFVGLIQAGGRLNLGLTFERFTPGKIWVRTTLGTWANVEDDGSFLPLALRANFGPCYPTYLKAQTFVTEDNGAGDGTAAVLAMGAGGSYTYQWNDPFAQTTQVALNLVGGMPYSCTISDSNGCTITVVTDTIPLAISIDNEMAGIEKLDIYPNPAKGNMNMELTLASPGELSWKLLTLKGKEILRNRIENTINYKSSINISNLTAGLYLFKVKTKTGTVVRKLAITP